VLPSCRHRIRNHADGQDPSIDWEYRVIAINKAGEGPPSNTTARLES
jgi:hypothetical protein